jgi:hypothetical protein
MDIDSGVKFTELAPFHDRIEAGKALAELLGSYRWRDALVVGIPRGGLVVAAEVARLLDAELDVIVARKLGAPGQQELAIGAVTADGDRRRAPPGRDRRGRSSGRDSQLGRRPGTARAGDRDHRALLEKQQPRISTC